MNVTLKTRRIAISCFVLINFLFLLLLNTLQIEFPSVSEDMIHTKDQYDEMIDELEKRFALPADAQVSRSHPLSAGTPVYAQFMNRLDPDHHAKWLPGTINSCMTNADGYTYHILFDNEEEARFLEGKCVLHRLDYDKIEWPKQE